jgi:hypothetical protein
MSLLIGFMSTRQASASRPIPDGSIVLLRKRKEIDLAQGSKWFATTNDAAIILDWFSEAGAVLLDGRPLSQLNAANGKEYWLHFPDIGPVKPWPARIRSPKAGDKSPRANRTALAYVEQLENPGLPMVDADRSTVAGLRLPGRRDKRFWVAGETWFPTTNLKSVFPELNRIQGQFKRFLTNFPTVFDCRKGSESDQTGFKRQLCMSGVLQKVIALPEAYQLLKSGACMVDPLASPYQFKGFRIRLQMYGRDPAAESSPRVVKPDLSQLPPAVVTLLEKRTGTAKAQDPKWNRRKERRRSE